VTADTSLRLSTVYKCIKAISESLGMLPMHLYRTMSNGERERVQNNPMHQLLAVRPNPWQTPMQFRVMMEAHRSLRGNAYARIIYDGAGNAQALVPLHPDRVLPEIVDGQPLYRVRPAGGAGAEEVLIPGELLHLTGLCLDGFVGMNPIQAEREAIGAGIASRDYGSRFWNNDARPPFWVKVPGKFENNEARTNFRDEWQASYGGSNRGRPAVMDRGMELQELGLSNADSQWIEARRYSDVDICGLWRVPPHKIGLLDRATWGNVEQMNIEFVTDCLMPLAVSWEQVLARDLLPDDGGLFFEILLDMLLRGDTTTRYTAYGKAIQDGWLTRNEARRLENRNPLPGLDEPLQPLNMTQATAASGIASPARQAPRQPARAVALLAASAERVARKEQKMLSALLEAASSSWAGSVATTFAGHEKFVADVMAVSAQAAAAYVADAVRLLLQTPLTEMQALLHSGQWHQQQVAALLQLEN